MANKTLDKEKKVVRTPLLGTPTYRNTTASLDQRYVNLFVETITNPETQAKVYYAVKRPGLTFLNQPSGGAALGRGMYSWNGFLYSVFGNRIYKGGTSIGAPMVTTTGLCDLIETSAVAGTPYLIVNDGIDLYLIKSDDTVTVISAATPNFPTPNLGQILYFDGYIIVAQANGRIYNSTNEDPTTWGALDYIAAQAFPDNLVGMARQNDVLLAFGEWSTQMFYDNGGASPGSFMANLAQATLQVGCASKNSIVQHENFVIWVSRALTGGFTIQKLDGVSNLKRVSTEPIERLLNAEGTNLTNCNCYAMRSAGHFFYVLNLTSSNRTLVYDIEEDHWTEWQSGSSGLFNYITAIQDSYTSNLQHSTNGKIYTIGPLVFQDDGVTIEVTLRTIKQDYDTTQRKFCSRFELVGDRTTTSNPVQVTYTDDDYQSYSTPRTVDMVISSTNIRPVLYGMGQFRRRAYNLFHATNNSLRLEGFETDIQTGSN